jgi:hypothetical protein
MFTGSCICVCAYATSYSLSFQPHTALPSFGVFVVC